MVVLTLRQYLRRYLMPRSVGKRLGHWVTEASEGGLTVSIGDHPRSRAQVEVMR